MFATSRGSFFRQKKIQPRRRTKISTSATSRTHQNFNLGNLKDPPKYQAGVLDFWLEMVPFDFSVDPWWRLRSPSGPWRSLGHFVFLSLNPYNGFLLSLCQHLQDVDHKYSSSFYALSTKWNLYIISLQCPLGTGASHWRARSEETKSRRLWNRLCSGKKPSRCRTDLGKCSGKKP